MSEDNQLVAVVQKSGMDVDSPRAQVLFEQFSDYFKIAAEWETKAKVIVVTDSDQVAEMKMAREGRLFLRQKRIAIEKKRKELKEQSLREGKAIDGMANILKALIAPLEEHLDKQEHFIEIREAQEAERLRIEAERKVAEERIATAKAEAEEQERIRLENETLKKEAEAREREIRAEREKAEAEIRLRKEELDRQKEESERQIREVELKHQEEKAEAARKQAEMETKLKSQIVCPHCGGMLYPDGTC